MGLPCATFSIAHAQSKPWRSLSEPSRVSGPSESEQATVNLGNSLTSVAVCAARASRRSSAPWMIENPLSSLVFKCPELLSLARAPRMVLVSLAFCLFGPLGESLQGYSAVKPLRRKRALQ